ncbi:MAG: primosomal protein N' [Omnitrophica WOR_2 bacterium RBG_13_41_10]|nr:MAG: primosomal protein N' [Omnitrophica WOR_2 bacterium RBG_13_41_10]
MLYAKIVLGLPVAGPFDYIVPEALQKQIKVGARVWVSFGNRRLMGYVVGLSHTTNIKNLKPILELLDNPPLINKNMLLLTKELSDYYCCSWGEAIETALPLAIRKGRKITQIEKPEKNRLKGKLIEPILIHDSGTKERWGIYLEAIKNVLSQDKSAIVILPDRETVFKAKEIIQGRMAHMGSELIVLYRNQPGELKEWLKILEGKVKIVVGSRSSIFAPVENLGLIIVDEEQNSVYKQDQVPHYHSRQVAFMRSRIETAQLILASSLPSLEMVLLAKQNKIKNIFTQKRENLPEIKIADTTYLNRGTKEKNKILSKSLEDAIFSALNTKGKILLFLNRRGYATVISCRQCGMVLKCPRCNINLVYHFKENVLSCHYCNFKMQPQDICPNCNAGYMRYSGLGIEKIESEIARIFPKGIIKRQDNWQKADINDADIFISTQSVIKETGYGFDLVGVLAIDNSLNRIDLRAAEKTFSLLIDLVRLSSKKMIIQTALPRHYCFQALLAKDVSIFYDTELKQRRQLGFAPYKNMALIKLRGKIQERVKKITQDLFQELSKTKKDGIRIISFSPGQPTKQRGNFYWQILLSASGAKKISRFLKIRLKKLRHSGIIVTVDVDPL